MAIEPNTSLVLCKARDSKVSGSVPDSESSAPLPIEPNWAPIMEFTTADIFQRSPFGDILNSLKSLSLSGEPWPDYGQHGWDADHEEIRSPPTTHFVATVDDLTDMLDFNSKDIDGMDTDEGDDQEPAPIGHWKVTSSYDIYLVYTPKVGDGDEKTEDDPSKKQPKHRCQWRRSKSPQSKNSESGTRDINTPDSAEDIPLQKDSAQEDEGASPHERAVDREVEDDNYMPPSEDEASLDDDEFVVPEDPVEQERFKRRLIATANCLKKK